jgi:serine/threonine-protein kinase
MSESKTTLPRGRTASRHRFVAPPGLSIRPSDGVKTVGRYEILETLGKGAMGVVYKARDPLLDRIVAVKTIGSPRGAGRRVQKAYLERFEREAKAAAKMQHPAIVTIFDVGLEGGAPFMVLEYLPGETLADRLDRVRMPLGKAIQIGIDLASALAFAHKQRIVHRDVKPANVLHAGEDRWKLADFGIVRMPDSDLTQVGIFMGTPGYSPPEAIKEGRYTPQADVFAWGAVLYELLTGAIPYEGPDTQTTNGYVLAAKAPGPRHYDPSVPQPLEDVVMRALGKSTEVRFRNGADAEKALRKAWEKCLTSGLVSPMALAGIEVPHERAPAQMHAMATEDAPVQAPVISSSGPVVLQTPKVPDKPAKKDKPKGKAGQQPMLVIESSSTAGDEDPTKIMVRDGDDDEPAYNVDLGDDDDFDFLGRDTEMDPDAAKRAAADAKRAADLADREARSQTATGDSKLWLWVAMVVAVLLAGGVAAFFLIKM